MRTLLPLSVAAGALSLWASAALADTTIAIIQPGALARSSLFAGADDQLHKEFDKRDSDLKAQGQKLQDDMDAYQKERDLVSGDERAKREKDLTTRRIDFDAAQRKLQDDLQNRKSEILRQIDQKVSDAIKQIAAAKGIDVVLQNPAYASDKVIDITDDVLKSVGGTVPAKGVAKPAAGAAPAKKK